MRPKFSNWLRSCFGKTNQPRSLRPLLEGYRASALLFVAAKLKIPDQLSRGALTSGEIAKNIGADEPSLHRLLRGLTTLGLCEEIPDGSFHLTRLGEKLRSNSPGSEYSEAILNGEEYAAAWTHLFHSVLTGETAFDHVFGESAWEHRQKNPEINERFNLWLERGAAATGEGLAGAYDFSRHKRVADIGGGQGALLESALRAHPSLQGILFDQSHVVAAARKRFESADVASRCRIIEGDFFTTIPVDADVFILKSVLHDWDDTKCSQILRNCRESLKSGGTLLVLEKIMPARASDLPSTIMSDLHMLAVTGGKERTEEEYRALLKTAGFEWKKNIPLRTGHTAMEFIRS